MRSFFKVFLVALLAIRALVGDAMAYDMMQKMSGAPAPVDISAKKAIAMPCHEAPSETDMAAQGSSSACTTCQVCHLSVFLSAALQLPEFQLPLSVQTTHIAAWFSADSAMVSKPPIL